MLHIHNGDSSAEIARESSLPGEHLPWREALMEGPAPADVSREKWRRLRARHLAESYGVDLAETENSLLVQEETLADYKAHDEVILWFEHDLFCQTTLIFLLNWFAEHDLGNTRLSLICIGAFSELPNFRGLGELSSSQMASLFDSRHQVSRAETALAVAAWKAYCSDDPTAIQTLMETDMSELPFLKPALQLHLERFPFVSNGLGRIQHRGLEFIHDGVLNFVDMFQRFGNAEPVYGLGDAQFWNTLRRMGEAQAPLLHIRDGAGTDPKVTSESFHQMTFEITEAGKAVLNARADFIEINGIDTWLGGVHLLGRENVWRWDSQKQGLSYI